jgi:hypothetical protein
MKNVHGNKGNILSLSKSVKCAIAENLVLAELLKKEHEAYIAHGPTQKGWDIALFVNNKVKRIQVKTIGWPVKDQRTITVSNELLFDYIVIVLLNLDGTHSRYLILTKSEINNLLSQENPNRINNSRSWYITAEIDKRISKFENAWNKIK